MDLPANEVLRGYQIDGAWLDEAYQAFDEGRTHACGVPLTPRVMAHLLYDVFPDPDAVTCPSPDIPTVQSLLTSDGRVFGTVIA
jgi:hypothetical protein